MEHPGSVRLYVGLVSGAALGLLATLMLIEGPVAPSGAAGLLLFGLGTAAIPVAGYCPVCIGKNIAVNMAGAVMFAMMLLLPPAYAAIGAALGMVILSAVLRWPAIDILFNAGQTALTVGGASAVLRFSTIRLGSETLGLVQVAVILAAVATFFIINSVVVSEWAALLHRSRFSNEWRDSFGRSAGSYVSTLLLGVVVAVTYTHSPLVTPALILPIIVVYRSLQNAAIIRRQTRQTIELLADTVDRRDAYTFAHSQRVAALARRIAERLGLPAEEQHVIGETARVHDLGKVGISDGLLLKPGRLSPAELESVRKHTVIGAEIIGKLTEYQRGKEYILFHHERYDGTGVFRLYGQHIPLGARIIAAADAYDAMTSDRPYRKAMPVDEALAEIESQKGRQFDPVVAEALIDIIRREANHVFEGVPVATAPAPVPQPSPAPS